MFNISVRGLQYKIRYIIQSTETDETARTTSSRIENFPTTEPATGTTANGNATTNASTNIVNIALPSPEST